MRGAATGSLSDQQIHLYLPSYQRHMLAAAAWLLAQ